MTEITLVHLILTPADIAYNDVKHYLYQRYGITHVAKCICGALTFEREHGIGYSVEANNAPKYFPVLSETFFERLEKQVPEYCNCNHCVNHWGLDLCACGSGEQTAECEEALFECGESSQHLEEVCGWNR